MSFKKSLVLFSIGALIGTVTGALINVCFADEAVVLSKANTLAFHDVFTESTVTALQSKALAISNNLPAGKPMYLFLDTPGGSVVAGEQLIATLKGLPRETKTITSFAASMGFITAESLGERFILPSGILMSHRATVGVEGQLPGEANTRLAFWSAQVSRIEDTMAARMQMTPAAYRNLIHDEYWVSGDKAVKDHAADKVVSIRCGKDMTGTYTETVMSMFGPVQLTWSDCPMISAPLAINFSGLSASDAEQAQLDQFKRATFVIYNDKYSFISNTTARETYFRFMK